MRLGHFLLITALIKQMAGNPMTVLYFLQLRFNLYAMLRAVFAAAGEGASWR